VFTFVVVVPGVKLFDAFVFEYETFELFKNENVSNMFVLDKANCSSSLRQLGDEVLLKDEFKFAIVCMSSSSISYNGIQSIIKSMFYRFE